MRFACAKRRATLLPLLRRQRSALPWRSPPGRVSSDLRARWRVARGAARAGGGCRLSRIPRAGARSTCAPPARTGRALFPAPSSAVASRPPMGRIAAPRFIVFPRKAQPCQLAEWLRTRATSANVERARKFVVAEFVATHPAETAARHPRIQPEVEYAEPDCDGPDFLTTSIEPHDAATRPALLATFRARRVPQRSLHRRVLGP